MYALHTTLDCGFDAALERVTEALKGHGFGVLTTIDVAATLKAKLGVEKRPYTILGACNPPLANRALELDADLGILMPCNVVVRQEEDGSVTAAFMNIPEVLKISQAAGLPELVAEAKSKMEAVIADL